jgi:hypothetical protein
LQSDCKFTVRLQLLCSHSCLKNNRVTKKKQNKHNVLCCQWVGDEGELPDMLVARRHLARPAAACRGPGQGEGTHLSIEEFHITLCVYILGGKPIAV